MVYRCSPCSRLASSEPAVSRAEVFRQARRECAQTRDPAPRLVSSGDNTCESAAAPAGLPGRGASLSARQKRNRTRPPPARPAGEGVSSRSCSICQLHTSLLAAASFTLPLGGSSVSEGRANACGKVPPVIDADSLPGCFASDPPKGRVKLAASERWRRLVCN